MGRVIRAIALAVLVLAWFPTPAAAADIRQGTDVIIGANETINDDLYAFGTTIQINGTVNGDVIAAGQSVSVDGTVTGSVIAAAQTLTIRGQVGGGVRAAANSLFIDGKVAGDVITADSEVTISANGRVGRDAITTGNTVTVTGQVGRHLKNASRALTIDGRVGGNVTTQVDTLRLTERAVVEGSLTYTSPSDASIASGAAVRGETTHNTPPAAQVQGPASTAIDWLRGLVGLLALGLFLVFFFPAFSRRSAEFLARSPLVSVGVGCGMLILVPILAIVIFIVGGIIGGWWLGLVALALYFAAIAVAIPIAALGLGAAIFRATQRPVQLALAFVVGAVILLILGIIPILGGFVMFLALLFGLGALTVAIASRERAEAVATTT